jgi:pyruvate dehydrogenase E2 component (dihydrolipoamide acetyltransferase)
MAEFVGMPKLGMNMTEGTIVEWLVEEGDQVSVGQPLLEVETDKVVQVVESPTAGVVSRITKEEGDAVPCGNVMAVITTVGESVPSEIPNVVPDAVRPTSDVTVVHLEEQGTAAAEDERAPGRRIQSSPVARKLAQELGIDLSEIEPAGKRISKSDVEAYYEAMKARAAEEKERVAEEERRAAEEAPPARVEPLRGVRRTIARHMRESARTVARVALSLEADATELIAWRRRVAVDGLEVGYNELLVKIVAHALREHPNVNLQLVDDEIRWMEAINVGVATETERGVLVPVIRDADGKSVSEIHRAFSALVERARNGESTLEDLSGGTFTVTNLGMYEVEEFVPIINVPECAILGVGAITEKPVADEGEVAIRPRMTLTLCVDHRLVDGAPAARFLQRIKYLIEQPLELLR